MFAFRLRSLPWRVHPRLVPQTFLALTFSFPRFLFLSLTHTHMWIINALSYGGHV